MKTASALHLSLTVAALAVGCGSPSTTPSAAPGADLDSTRISDPGAADASAGDAHAPPVDASAGIDASASNGDAADVSDGGAPDVSTVNQCGYTQCAANGPCADLTIDSNEMASSVVISTQTFQPASCEIVEGCITTPGTRRLLRFDMATVNVGNADLRLGQPATAACFQFSECHGHYHFQGFARYTLYRPDGFTVAAVGHKQSFCIEDVEQSNIFTPADITKEQQYDCNNQGLHVGWQDVYPNDVPCQWVDITDVPPGDYVLSAVVNAARAIPELDYANNEVRVPVTIPPAN